MPRASSTVESGPTGPANRWLLALALASVYLVWGSTYLVMRIAVHTLPPMLLGAVRFSIAGAILLGWSALRGAAWPTPRQWAAAVPIAVFLFVGGNGFVAIAELEVSSGVAAVVCATMPLWMAVFSRLVGERPTRREWVGVGLGVGGVVVLVSGAEMAATPVAAAVICAAPLAWAIGSLLARRLPTPPGLMAAASQLLLGGVTMAAAGWLRGERLPPLAAITFETVWSVAYLVTLGSLVGFTAYAWLLRHTRPAVATSYAFVNPVLAVFLGAVLGGEPVGTATLVATPVIVVAVILVVGDRQR